MSMTLIIAIVILLVLAFIVAGAIILFSTRKLGSALPDDQKPEWVRAAMEQANTPISTTEGSQERMASPVAEAIEGLLQEALQSHPELAGYQIDLGSAPDGGLEIWVNGEKFDGIDALKDENLKKVFREVVAAFNK